ncbi:hypothetical protein N665_0067s0022 [Sinapis alba]|nr:hypothetical protein N665_0067s0022 [Sinapis alba]
MPFGKLVAIVGETPFSGRLGHLPMSKQLNVAKKHEVWFLFAGKPVRFSIREFAIVTGLNCRNYLPQSKKRSKKDISEKPYWGAFYVVTMLRRKIATHAERRIKYALLALLAAVILPTSHNPRISHAHAEQIKDLNTFLEHPWSHVSFEMLMSSIKERDEVSLSQNTIALKGFVLSIQLDGGSSGSEVDSVEDEAGADADSGGNRCINTAHVRDIDTACKALVYSIIPAAGEENITILDSAWGDDVQDVLVDNLLKCIENEFSFSNAHFIRGLNKVDVQRIRQKAVKENVPRKKTKVSKYLNLLLEQMKHVEKSITSSQNLLRTSYYGADKARFPCSQSPPPHSPASKTNKVCTSPHVDAGNIIQNTMRFAEEDILPTSNVMSLVGEYHCDKRVLTRAWEGHLNAMRKDSNIDYAAKFCALAEKIKVPFGVNVDGLSLDNQALSTIVDRSSHLPAKCHAKNFVILDTKFVSLIAKTFGKFSKSSKKESFRFPASFGDCFSGDVEVAEAHRFYFPFNFDKKHWAGVCVDCVSWQVVVLDCNVTLRTDGMIVKDLRPISIMFPYLLKHLGKLLGANDLKPLAIDRPRSIPQNPSVFDSGTTAVLLIEAHAVGGGDEVVRIAVMTYEDNVGAI